MSAQATVAYPFSTSNQYPTMDGSSDDREPVICGGSTLQFTCPHGHTLEYPMGVPVQHCCERTIEASPAIARTWKKYCYYVALVLVYTLLLALLVLQVLKILKLLRVIR